MYTNNRDTYRQTYFDLWEKHLKKSPLEPVEAQLLDVILEHPEYHRFLDKSSQDQEFELEENPFFHMSLHLAIREQLQTNRPAGVVDIQRQLLAKEIAAHECEHLMMNCLAQMLFQMQQTGSAPNESDYVVKLRELVSQAR